ncbi:TetR/AcrR family transcriptional regulator [Haliovirga abyssi]|uniref:HTH tetR-type domain-containing protein n=1 Tax=Haliovirga abyssi TaxID=2996794 RepID=A0AAU9DSK0_9FUSO|nr:TetR/AcrR family transcriptional regulator [Haliovirga abyssi]BDU51613.1 hypothetical protein HLVA_21820 [Haliovirga abyssi]
MNYSKTYLKIINTAYKLIAENGYDKTSINNIVKEAGISKGGLYHYFKSKEELFIKVVEYIFQSFDFINIFNSSTITIDNYMDKLKNIGKMFSLIDAQDENYFKFQNEFMIQALRDENIKGILTEIYNEFMPMIENLFLHLKNIGVSLREKNIKTLSEKVFVFLDGLMIYKGFGISLDCEKLWNSFLEDLII